MYMKYRKEILKDDQVKVHMITTDKKVPALIKFLKKHNPNEDEYLPTDLVTTPVNSGSEEYFDWVKKQVEKPDSSVSRDSSNVGTESDIQMALKNKQTAFDRKFGLPQIHADSKFTNDDNFEFF